MRIEQDAQVVTMDGEKVGQVDRVVMDPRTKEVSHLVVRKGLLFPEDRVVPIEMVTESDEEDQLQVKAKADELEELPLFEETYYVRADEREQQRSAAPAARSVPPMYWYPPYPSAAWGRYGVGFRGPEYVAHTEKSIPSGSVALADGAKVVSADGEHVGNIEQVLADPGTERATHFVISSGMLFKTRKLVPTTWITDMARDEVHLGVSSQTLDNLREYKPEEHKR